jgi:hypothetical protein
MSLSDHLFRGGVLSGTSSVLVFPVTGENAGEAFQHPFRYAP